jgi:hypothetical protein
MDELIWGPPAPVAAALVAPPPARKGGFGGDGMLQPVRGSWPKATAGGPPSAPAGAIIVRLKRQAAELLQDIELLRQVMPLSALALRRALCDVNHPQSAFGASDSAVRQDSHSAPARWQDPDVPATYVAQQESDHHAMLAQVCG